MLLSAAVILDDFSDVDHGDYFKLLFLNDEQRYEYLKCKCVETEINCVEDENKCVGDEISCVEDEISCVGDDINCVEDEISCVGDEIISVEDEKLSPEKKSG